MGFQVNQEGLLAARSGDRDAFRRLVETLSKDVYNMAYRVTFNATDAHDLSQEIFVTLYRNLHRYDPERPFAPWFRRVASNTAINYRKRQKPARSLPEALPAREERDSLTADEVALVEGALKDLPPEYRLVVTFHYYQGMEVRDIATTMDIPVGTVKTWLFRARETLRERLGKRFGVRA